MLKFKLKLFIRVYIIVYKNLLNPICHEFALLLEIINLLKKSAMSGGTAGTNININIIQCLLYTHDMRIQQQIVNKDGAI